MTEAVKDFHRRIRGSCIRIQFMSSLLRIVTGPFREVAEGASAQGVKTTSGESILSQ